LRKIRCPVAEPDEPKRAHLLRTLPARAITAAAKSSLLRGELVSRVHRPARHGAAGRPSAPARPVHGRVGRERAGGGRVPPSRSFSPRVRNLPRARTSAGPRGKLPRSRSPTASRWISAAPGARQRSMLAKLNPLTLDLRRAGRGTLPRRGGVPRRPGNFAACGAANFHGAAPCRGEYGSSPPPRGEPAASSHEQPQAAESSGAPHGRAQEVKARLR